MEQRRPPRGAVAKATCSLRGHKWRKVLNPAIYECERCDGRWEQVEEPQRDEQQ